LVSKKTIILVIGLLMWSSISASEPFESFLHDDTRFMIVIEDNSDAKDFLEYAENILKKGIKSKGGKIINPELIKKVKADKLLWQAIQNGNATAMAQISTDYGARILIIGELAVESHEKFSTSYEGIAGLSIQAVDTTTAEEIANVSSSLMGTSENPAPIEDSPLIAKQLAVKKACEDVLFKLGIGAGSDIRAVESYSFDLHDVYDTRSGAKARIIFLSGQDSLAVGEEHTIAVIRLKENRKILLYDGLSREVTAIAASPDGQYVVAGDKRGVIVCFDTESNSVKFETRIKGPVRAFAFRPDSRFLVATGGDYRIHCYATAKGLETTVLKGHQKQINSLAFTPNGKNLVSSSHDLSIRWWDINTGKQKKAFSETTDKLLAMSLSSDGSLVATSIVTIRINLLRKTRTDHRKIIIRSTITGEEIKILEGHKEDIRTLCFHPAKRFLASGADDKTVRIWDLQKGETVSQLNLSDSVYDNRFSPDGHWLAVSTVDGKIWIWKIK